jgi:hypothetical protein
MPFDTALSALARRQLGLVTTADVAEAGITRQSWSRRVAAGLWIRMHPRVYRTAQHPTSDRQRALAALLYAGPTSMLSHRSAGWLQCYDGFALGAVIDVTVPRANRVRASPGISVHVADRILYGDCRDQPPFRVTSPARTLSDLAACCGRSELENAMDSALRMGLVHVDEVAERVQHVGGRGTVLLRQVFEGLPQGGLHTRLEREFLVLSRAAGLEDPVAQVVFRSGTQFLARVDFRYAGLKLIVGVSGHRRHSSRQERAADAQRMRRLVAAGQRVIEFTSDEVFGKAASVQAELGAWNAAGHMGVRHAQRDKGAPRPGLTPATGRRRGEGEARGGAGRGRARRPGPASG